MYFESFNLLTAKTLHSDPTYCFLMRSPCVTLGPDWKTATKTIMKVMTKENAQKQEKYPLWIFHFSVKANIIIFFISLTTAIKVLLVMKGEGSRKCCLRQLDFE